MQTVIKSINGIDIPERAEASGTIRDFKSLKEISLILESEKIERLELGTDHVRVNVMLSSLESLTEQRKNFQNEWNRLFSENTDFSLFQKILDNPLDFVQTKYIKKNGFDKKLDFVKKEKLVEIVDFPDFGKLLTSISRLFDLQSNHVFKIISFEEAFSKALTSYPESYERKIKDACEIVLTGKDKVQKYLWVNLLYLASNKLKKEFGNPDFERFSEKVRTSGVITDYPSEMTSNYRLDKEKLINHLTRES